MLYSITSILDDTGCDLIVRVKGELMIFTSREPHPADLSLTDEKYNFPIFLMGWLIFLWVEGHDKLYCCIYDEHFNKEKHCLGKLPINTCNLKLKFSCVQGVKLDGTTIVVGTVDPMFEEAISANVA